MTFASGTFFNTTANECQIACDADNAAGGGGGDRRRLHDDDSRADGTMLQAGEVGTDATTARAVISHYLSQQPGLAHRLAADPELLGHFEALGELFWVAGARLRRERLECQRDSLLILGRRFPAGCMAPLLAC